MTIDVPGGIDDASNRALTQLINERFDGIQSENVLVWFLAGQTQEQLVLAAELLGLTGPEFGGAAPTVEILKQGVLLRLRKGTPDALEQVLASLLYDEDALDEEAFKYLDGTWNLSGEWRLGADRSSKFFQIYFNLTPTVTVTVVEQQKIWDAVERWNRAGCAFAIGFRQTGQPTIMIRSRAEIVSDIVPVAPPPPPVLTSLDLDLADILGGDSITITGTHLDSASACTVGGTAATITANTATSLTFTVPAKAAGTYNVQVTTAGGTSNALSLEMWSPAQLAGVAHEYRADVGITQAGGKVSQWNDQIGTAHLVQATGAKQPTYNATDAGYNAKPTVQSTAVTQFLAATGVAHPQPYTVWLIGEFGTGGNVCSIDLSTVGGNPYIGVNGGNLYEYAGITLSSAVSGAVKHAARCTLNGATSVIAVNNWLTGGVSGNAGASNMTALATFTFSAGTSGTIGKLAALIVQAAVPTSTEKTKMAKWVKRFGINVT